MYILGIDLSGPSNTDETVLVVARKIGDHCAILEAIQGATDGVILECVTKCISDSEVIVGIDAPLSYNPGGGLRPSDIALKKRTVAAGMRSGSVMPPTLNRMVYLTLRGVSIARSVEETYGDIRVVEVHPGAAMALRGAEIRSVLSYKSDAHIRVELLSWLDSQGMTGAEAEAKPSSHYVDACAAALAAWKWSEGAAVWCHPAETPAHPYDFAC